MHILVTNDDGVSAPGLLALAEAMRDIADKVSVFAPDRNWTASGHVKTFHRPIRITETVLADGTFAWMTDGAPSDCVALAQLGFIPEKIDLVVSGINPTANLGHDITYSGTVTAAMEAAIWGIPGVAFSLDKPDGLTGSMDFRGAAVAAHKVVSWLIQQGELPAEMVLSVNVPYRPLEDLQGFAITRQGLRIYRDALVRRVDPLGRPYYWIGGEAPTAVDEPGTDYGALAAGYVSVTPIQLDLTSQKTSTWLESRRFSDSL